MTTLTAMRRTLLWASGTSDGNHSDEGIASPSRYANAMRPAGAGQLEPRAGGVRRQRDRAHPLDREDLGRVDVVERRDLDERLAVHAVHPQRGPQAVIEVGPERLLRLPDLRRRDRSVRLSGDVQDRARGRVRVEVERRDDLVVRLRAQL